MDIGFSKYSFLLFLGLFIAQPVFAQNESIDNCAAEIDNDPGTLVDIDDDDDGLIELCYLEDVDAIRHNLNGTGLRRGNVTLSAGCPTDGCNGYELVGDLDFTTTQSYVSGVVNDDWVLSNDDFTGTTKPGWSPIGYVFANCTHQVSRCFTNIFEGNGYNISNLHINRDSAIDLGLFVGNQGTIRNFGLSEIRVEGFTRVGGLVGQNQGRLMNVYVDGGRVTGSDNTISLLAGINRSSGLIINSYAHGTVLGGFTVGGITGYNVGRIINSYANIDVSGSRSNVGGLVGEIEMTGFVINSYVAGIVFGNSGLIKVGGLIGAIDDTRVRVSNGYSIAEVGNINGGGLIGSNINSAPVRDSYWDIETSERTTSVGGIGRTTAQLQMPSGATGIYANWSSGDWDFGDEESYPALRYARGDDNNNPACDVDPDTSLPPCGAVLSGQTIRDRGLSILFFVIDGVQQDNARVFRDQPFSPVVFDYDIKIPGRRPEIALRPYAINDTATISVFSASDQDTNYFDGRHSGDLSTPIILEADTAEVLRLRVDGLTYNFNLIREPQPPVEVVSFGTIPPIATVNEGDDITLQAVFRNGSGNYQYSLQQQNRVLVQGQNTTGTITVTVADAFVAADRTTQNIVQTITDDDGSNIASTALTLIAVTVPDVFVAADRTTQSIVYTITADDGFNIVSTALTLTVSKENNGAPQLELNVSPTALHITSAADDPDGVGTFGYQWQLRDEGDSDWSGISVANPYTVSGTSTGTVRYRVIVNHTDGQGYGNTYRVGPFPINVDGDGDGLIDVYYLEDLDAIRNQPDGSGYGLAAVDSTITSGCPTNTCTGYELLRDLDFTTTQSYVDVMSNKNDWTVDDDTVATDTGWLPIATVDAPFTSLFNGNNNHISNLQINRDTVDDASIGLFAALSSEARLENVGILDVAIGGRGSVGSLVGQNEGVIANSYAQGEVGGVQHRVGGLVAFNDATGVIINSYANVMTTSTAVLSGGLVGNNAGTIRNSYAAGGVGGACDVGGLVAENGSEGEIVNSYAQGAVSRSGSCGDDGTRTRAGGLVADNAGLIRNSYVRGLISAGGGTAGGLFAVGATGTVEFSYWDSTVNSAITTDSMAMTTAELQRPESARDIYKEWDGSDWDFGTRTNYPILRYTSPTDIAIAPVCDDDLDTALPPCGSVLLAQAQSGLSNLLFFVGDDAVALNPPFSLSVLNYTVNVENANTIELLPYSINPQGESIAIRRVGDQVATDYFMGKRSGGRSSSIPLPGGESTLEIVVGTDSDDMSSVTYSITVTNTVNRVVVEEIIAPDRVSEGDTISLSATVMGGARAVYRYRWTSDPVAFLDGLAEQDRTAATLSFSVPIDFVSRDATGRDVKITLTVGDGLTSSSATRTVTVVKVDNGVPSFTETVTVSSISIDIVPESDADGDGTIDSYTWQRRNAGDTEWTTIGGQTSAMFSIPTQDNGGTLYRVQVMSTDAQGNDFNSLLGPYRNRTDIDDDDDGLIDIYYLEDLDAVRHQTDGSGYGSTDITRGCRLVGGSETCMGYELRRDLDFASIPSYVNITTRSAMWMVDNFDTNNSTSTGWNPIGSVANNNCSDTSSDCFSGVFEGNGYSISNLQINRDGTNEIGMFAGNTGTIRNLGLREIEVEGNTRVGGLVGRNEGNLINVHVIESRVEGGENITGLLVGLNSGLIINSYVHGTVLGFRWAAGICGINFGRIINSYAEVMASGFREAGGLAAENQGIISNSYAMGSAHITANDANNRRSVGGLLAVLWTGTNPSVTNTYSTVRVTADSSDNNIGGLIGNRHVSNPPVTASYWDTDTSERTASPGGGTAQTTVDLQMPTNDNSATGVYAGWSTADWDFGTTEQYPALLYNEVAGVDACDTDAATPLPRCGSLLPGQRAVPFGENTTPTITLAPSTAQLLPLGTMPDIMVSVADSNYGGGDRVTLTAMSSSRTIVSVTPLTITDIADNTVRTFTLNALQGGVATITFTATDSVNLSSSGTLEVVVNTPPTRSARVPTRAIIATVGVPFERDISEFFSDADDDTLTYGIAIAPPSGLIDGFSTANGTWTFTATDADVSRNTAGSTVTVSADDGRGGRVQASFTLLIDAPLTGAVRIAPDSDDRWRLRTISTLADANGIATTSYRWFINDTLIDGATENDYRIPDDRPSRTAGTRYRLEATVVDNIGQSVTTRSNVYMVANIAPMITRVNVAPSPVSEGGTVSMTAEASDENFDSLSYRWRVSSINADEADVSGATAPLTIRDYFVTDATADTATASFMVIVSDGTTATTGMFSVMVNKEDNGVVSVNDLVRSPTTETRLIFTGIDETGETDGGARGDVTYHWQQCLGSRGDHCSIDAGDGSGWQDIAGQTGTLGDSDIFYEVPDMLSSPQNHRVRAGDRFRVRIAYTDLQAYTRTVYSPNLGARLGQNTTPTIRVDDSQDTDITLLERGRITVDVSVDDEDGGTLNVEVVSADDTIASATISGDGADRTLEISGESPGEAMITATVDDGTGEVNSTASLVFDVTVVENTAPAISVAPSSAQTLPINGMTDIVVSVADGNFNLDDVVTLTAVSSTPSVVSVLPQRIADITTDTSTTFMLNARQSGVATITFTATDSVNLSSSGILVVTVNTPPRLGDRVPTQAIVATVGVPFELQTGSFFEDADGDALTYGIAIVPTNDLIDGFSTMTGVWIFKPTDADASRNTTGSVVTVSADDGRGGSVQTGFTLLIDAPLTGAVRIEADSDDRWRLRTISTFADANGITTTSYRWFTNGNPIDGATENEYRIPDNRASRAAGTSYRVEVMVIDNIERETTRSSVYTVPNIAPMITLVNVAPSPTTEGGTVLMTAEASDENFDSLSYSWLVSGINANARDMSGDTASLTIRDYFVTDATADTATASFVVVVSDGTTATIGMFSVVANKEDNGVVSVNDLVRSPTTETRLICTGIDETSETDGGVRGAVTYYWQQCLGSLGNNCSIDAGDGSGWQDIAGQTGILGDSEIFYDVPNTLSVPPNHRVRSGDRFRVRIAYTDLQAYTRNVYSSDLAVQVETSEVIRIRAKVFLEGPLQ